MSACSKRRAKRIGSTAGAVSPPRVFPGSKKRAVGPRAYSLADAVCDLVPFTERGPGTGRWARH